MKKITATLNPILFHIKYLLLATLVFFGMVVLAQFLFQSFMLNLEAITGNLKQTLLPLMASAAFSMYFFQKFQNKSTESIQ